MKIAVCFFGITRNFARYTLDSIQRNLFKEVERRDPHFRRLAHFNRVNEITNHRSREDRVPVDPDDYKLLGCDAVEQTDQELVDQQIDFDYIKQFGNAWRDDFGSLRNLLRQYYSLNSVTDMLSREKERPGLVIFTRADLRFDAPVKIPRIRPRTLYTPWFDTYHGLNDRFAMGDFETMVAYGRRQSMIRQYCADDGGQPLTSEQFLLWYARKQGLHTRHLQSINFSRVRSDGRVAAPDCTFLAKLKCRFKRGLELAGLRTDSDFRAKG